MAPLNVITFTIGESREVPEFKGRDLRPGVNTLSLIDIPNGDFSIDIIRPAGSGHGMVRFKHEDWLRYMASRDLKVGDDVELRDLGAHVYRVVASRMVGDTRKFILMPAGDDHDHVPQALPSGSFQAIERREVDGDKRLKNLVDREPELKEIDEDFYTATAFF